MIIEVGRRGPTPCAHSDRRFRGRAPNPLLPLGHEIPLVQGFFFRQAGVRWRGDAICCPYRWRVAQITIFLHPPFHQQIRSLHSYRRLHFVVPKVWKGSAAAVETKCGSERKFVGLRFCVSHQSDACRRRIGIVADESFHTCEICGQPGTLREDGLIKTLTLCDPHAGGR